MANKQRETFMMSEGDEWYKRNKPYEISEYLRRDPICKAVEELAANTYRKINVLEVGCSDGRRLRALKSKYDWIYEGVEPSGAAVEAGRSNGIKIYKGSAEDLPIMDKSIDILIYGFCLYLCDREELFLISAEGNRVTKNKSWIIIHDFWAKADTHNDYHHKAGIKSYKTKPEDMFLWHPNYTMMDAKIRDISTHEYTDEQNNWTRTSIIRKKSSD